METAPPKEPALHDGFTEEREIEKGETRAYTVDLAAGQYLRVTVQEEGVDLEVRLIDPGDKPVVKADSYGLPSHPNVETEDLAALANQAGKHRLEVAASKRQGGHYLLRVEGPRAPEPADRTRAEAVNAFWRGAMMRAGSEAEKIQYLERAAALWEKLGESRKTVQILSSLGHQRYELRRYDEAIGNLRQAAALWTNEKGPQSRAWEAWTINILATSLKYAGRPEEARSAYEKALGIAREIGDDAIQADVLSNLGLLASEEGETRKGIDLQLQALALKRKIGDQETETLSNLAYAYTQVSEHQKAIQYYQETLTLARRTSKHGLEALALNQLALLSSTLGNFERALSQYQEALAINRAEGESIKEAKTLVNLGAVYQHLGRFEEARAAYDQALALARKIQDLETQTATLISQSYLTLKLGQPARAVEIAQQALSLARGSREREANSHYALGLAYQGAPNLVAARHELETALTLYHERGNLPAEADVRLALARLDRDGGDLPSALSRVHEALGIVESLRIRVVDQDLRTSFSAARQEYYELEIEILMALHDRRPTEGFAADALKASETARARTLLEVLKESEADIQQGASPELVRREREQREEVNRQEWLRERLLAEEKPDPAKLAEAEKRLEEAMDDYTQVKNSLRENSPRYAALTHPDLLGVAGVQAEILDGQALLLEYSLGAERSFLWIVGPHSLDSFTLPNRETIEKAAHRYYELLTAHKAKNPSESRHASKARIADLDTQAEQAGRDLYRMILQPAAKLLKDQPLLVVADGALQYIPFAALPVPASGEPLVAQHEVVTLPSATALAELRRELRERAPAPRELAIFADPVYKNDPRLKLAKAPRPEKAEAAVQLPMRGALGNGRDTLDVSGLRRLFFSKEEANAIAALVPPSLLSQAMGFEASKSRVTSGDLKDFRKLHFATHGILDTRHPELSGLVLSLYDEQGKDLNGVLRLNDVYNLRLDADLVVLSACRTALGQEWRGEGLIGLTRGFMYAGAARVVASLWSVEDQATAELMKHFYLGMLREGLSPSAALRKAQLAMWRNPKRKAPFYWAGFSLQGEWR